MPTGPKPDCDILIAGGGFVGMAQALALADDCAGKGFEIILADAADPAKKLPRDWRASAITAASSRMLKRLGVWDKIGEENIQAGLANADQRRSAGAGCTPAHSEI